MNCKTCRNEKCNASGSDMHMLDIDCIDEVKLIPDDFFETILKAREKMLEATGNPKVIVLNENIFKKIPVNDGYVPQVFGMEIHYQNLPSEISFYIKDSWTNADRIRSMTDDELVDWITRDCPGSPKPCIKVPYRVDCKSCWLEWLKAEVRE